MIIPEDKIQYVLAGKRENAMRAVFKVEGHLDNPVLVVIMNLPSIYLYIDTLVEFINQTDPQGPRPDVPRNPMFSKQESYEAAKSWMLQLSNELHSLRQ